MPPRKTTPTTFDGWLGKLIDDETSTLGGRPVVAGWIGVSEQSVNRRARGEVPYLAREVQIIAARAGFEVSDLVTRALTKYGGPNGIEKLIAAYGPKVSEAPDTVNDEEPNYAGHVRAEYDTAADTNKRR